MQKCYVRGLSTYNYKTMQKCKNKKYVTGFCPNTITKQCKNATTKNSTKKYVTWGLTTYNYTIQKYVKSSGELLSTFDHILNV